MSNKKSANIYRVSLSSQGLPLYFGELEQAVSLIRLTASSVMFTPSDYRIELSVTDREHVTWESLSYTLKQTFEYEFDKWAEAGMPTELAQEESE